MEQLATNIVLALALALAHALAQAQAEQAKLPDPADYPAAGPTCRSKVKMSPWFATPGVDWPKTYRCVLSIHTCDGSKSYKSDVRPSGASMCDDYRKVYSELASREICCDACTGAEAKKRNPGGNSLAPGDPVYDGMVDGARQAGIEGFGPEHIGMQGNREKDGFIKFQIRVDPNGCILPNGDCVLWAGEKGLLPKGKQVPGKQMMVGGVRFAGNALRVNGRYVNVETGVVEGAAQSDTVHGTDRAAVARAMADMLRKLGLRCRKARGLNF